MSLQEWAVKYRVVKGNIEALKSSIESGHKVEGKDAVLWALENNELIGGKEAVFFALKTRNFISEEVVNYCKAHKSELLLKIAEEYSANKLQGRSEDSVYSNKLSSFHNALIKENTNPALFHENSDLGRLLKSNPNTIARLIEKELKSPNPNYIGELTTQKTFREL